MATKSLETYLNDHLAGSTPRRGPRRDRSATAREGTLKTTMAQIAAEIEEDREKLT